MVIWLLKMAWTFFPTAIFHAFTTWNAMPCRVMFSDEIIVYKNKHINYNKMGKLDAERGSRAQDMSGGKPVFTNLVKSVCSKDFFGAGDKHCNLFRCWLELINLHGQVRDTRDSNTNNTYAKCSQAWKGNCKVQVPSSDMYSVSTHCVSCGNYIRHVGFLQTMNSQFTGGLHHLLLS